MEVEYLCPLPVIDPNCPECHGEGGTIVPSCQDDPWWPCETCYPRKRITRHRRLTLPSWLKIAPR